MDHMPVSDDINIHRGCHATLRERQGCSLHEPVFDKFHAWVLKTLETSEVTLDSKT